MEELNGELEDIKYFICHGDIASYDGSRVEVYELIDA